MPEQRRRFSPQFKAEAVQMVIETGKPVAEVARDLGVNDGTLGNWVKAWRHANPEPDKALSPDPLNPFYAWHNRGETLTSGPP
jgi:transposase-like protein